MGSAAKVKPLAKEVRSTMRSGTIIFDLPRVVEELVLNSLDASASRVSVYVGVGNCYVKVVDDGCGISRDGLVLLGERYATSKKYQPAETDAADQNFGYRGEALASISDVSLLEIFTRASGRPNGYRKVIKESKCLYLGIDDDRKEIGTTVCDFNLNSCAPYWQLLSGIYSTTNQFGGSVCNPTPRRFCTW